MCLGFGGVFFTNGQFVKLGLLVMANGAIVVGGAHNEEKVTPILHFASYFASYFASPYVPIPETKAGYISPLP